MANIVFNIAKGRVIEFYNRVESNDPASSALILIPQSYRILSHAWPATGGIYEGSPHRNRYS